jgi:phosphatidylglycerophosphate synthase
VLAAWLFVRGDFTLGLVAAWIMTFLDTVDGKLARVTLTSSTVGHVLDHGLDLIHPPFWYLAWAFGLFGGAFWFDTSTLIIVIGYIVGRLIEGLFLLAFKMEIHCWRPLDSFFRAITARRNPNLILLTLGTLLGYPAWGFVLVATWTVFSIGFHTIRLLQAGVLSLRGHTVEEWQGKTLSSSVLRQAPRNTSNRFESPA